MTQKTEIEATDGHKRRKPQRDLIAISHLVEAWRGKSKAVTFSRRMDVSTVVSMRSCTYNANLTALHETGQLGGCRTCRLADAAAEAFREEAALAVGVAQRQDVDQLLRRAVEGQACSETGKYSAGLPTAIVACHWPY